MTTKVHYFDGYGRAEPIRMLLVYCKIDFENINYTDETLPIAKASGNLEFGQLSVLEVEEVLLIEWCHLKITWGETWILP